MSFSINRLKKSYKSLEIILSDAGIELKAEMMPYKRIEWKDLEVEEKSNGIINLYDKSILRFISKMNGRGWIQIQPEIMDKEVLLKTLLSKTNH